jgi:hypothetical protein
MHAKLSAFLENLRNGKYHNGSVVETKCEGKKSKFEYKEHDRSGTKPIIYIMQVIEYQHRGLPHAHIVYRIGTAPKPSKEKETPDQKIAREKETIKYIDGYEDPPENGTTRRHLGHVIASRPGKVILEDGQKTDADEEAQNIVDDLVGTIFMCI